jgi:hypothetical protein
MREDSRDIIAIPTFNRIRHLVACLRCLREAYGFDQYRVFIRDDASSEFGVGEIARLMPEAASIVRNATNLGPDGNQMLLFKDCIDAGAPRILVLDSDMLVSPSILDFIDQAFERTDGFLGLYNSVLHSELGDVDSELIEKRSVGGAATCWQSSLLRRVIDRYERKPTETWDWIANAELAETKTRIIVSRRSYAQHTGIVGANNGIFGKIEYGLGFVIETQEQMRFMAATFDDLMSHQGRFAPQGRKTKPRAWYRNRFLESLKRAR